MGAMSPLRGVDPQVVTREAAGVRALLEARVPGFAASRRPYAAQPDDPTLVRALWSEIGWSDTLAGLDLAAPERAPGVARVEALLASHRSDEFDLDRSALPDRFRLVGADDDGVGFSITDESSASDDPPVAIVLFDDAAIVPGAASYVGWCAAAMIRRAFREGVFATLRTAGLPAGSAPWPHLVPCYLAHGHELFAIPQSPEQRDPGASTLVAGTIAALVDWLVPTHAAGVTLEHLANTRTDMTDGDAAPAGFVALAGFGSRAAWIGRDEQGAAVVVAWSPGKLLWHRDP